MNLLQMSFYGAVLILVITALRAAAINKLPKKTFLILWGIAMVRLLIPYELPSPLSVYSLFGSDTPAAAVEETEAYYENYSPVSPSVSFESSEKLKPSQPKEQIPPLSSETGGFVSVWFVIWLSGSILLAAFFTLSYLRCYFEFKTSLPAENEFARQWLIEHKIKRPLSIRQSDKITVPLTYGVFRPVILMPKQTDWENTKQLRYVLLHEYVHVCRFDAFLKLICVFVLCLHWFNPAVWLMYVLFNRDIELACDERVVKKSGLSSKAEYALMLIGTEEKKAGLMPLFSGFGKNCAKERIVAVMKIKKASALAVAAAVILTAGVTMAFATSAEYGEIYGGENARETAFSENIADPKMYEEYKPFGLTVSPSDSKLYYGGKLVRCFDDRIPTGFFSEKAIGYYEKNGVVDIRAVRENSKLTGLEVLSQEEFDGRTIKEDVSNNDTASGTSMFDIYLEYGLEYDKAQNALFYGDKRVRLFWDCLSSDSKPSASYSPFISTVSNWDEKGTVDLYAVRDYRQKDENGYGKITGLRIADQQEFENNTSLFADRNVGAEYADGNAAVTVPEDSVGLEGMDEREAANRETAVFENIAEIDASALEEEIATLSVPSSDGKPYEELNAEFLFSEDGLNFQIAANKAALAFLRNDKEELSQYLADPSYDTGLSDDGTYLLDRLQYMFLKLPTNTLIENNGVYSVTYQYVVKDVEMLLYIDLGLIKTDSGWKVEYIYRQG